MPTGSRKEATPTENRDEPDTIEIAVIWLNGEAYRYIIVGEDGHSALSTLRQMARNGVIVGTQAPNQRMDRNRHGLLTLIPTEAIARIEVVP